MANLLKHADLVREPEFKARVQAAAVQAALNISGESTNAEDQKSMLRQAYAQNLFRATGNDLSGLFWAVAANASILQAYANGNVGDIPDGDIEFVISTVWDDVSGAARVAAYVPPPAEPAP